MNYQTKVYHQEILPDQSLKISRFYTVNGLILTVSMLESIINSKGLCAVLYRGPLVIGSVIAAPQVLYHSSDLELRGDIEEGAQLSELRLTDNKSVTVYQLNHLCVDRKFRNKGHAKTLIKAMSEACKSLGIRYGYYLQVKPKRKATIEVTRWYLSIDRKKAISQGFKVISQPTKPFEIRDYTYSQVRLTDLSKTIQSWDQGYQVHLSYTDGITYLIKHYDQPVAVVIISISPTIAPSGVTALTTQVKYLSIDPQADLVLVFEVIRSIANELGSTILYFYELGPVEMIKLFKLSPVYDRTFHLVLEGCDYQGHSSKINLPVNP